VQVKPTVRLDVGVGRMDRIEDANHQRMRINLTYTAKTHDAADVILDFFLRRGGRCREFFMPTWEDDIVLTNALDSADTRLEIDGVDFAAFWTQDRVRDMAGVAIVPRSGDVIFRKITDIAAESGISYIEVDQAIGVDMSLDDILYICWVPLWRLSSDTLTQRWVTNGVCQMALTMETLPYNAPDDDSNSNSASGSGSPS